MGAFTTKKILYGDVSKIANVVIAQIWGMIKQSKLDEKAVAVAERAVYKKY